MTVEEYRQMEIESCKMRLKTVDIIDKNFNCEDYKVPEYIAKHIEKFGIPPDLDFRDICWDGDWKEIEKAVLESIKNNKPFVFYDWIIKN